MTAEVLYETTRGLGLILWPELSVITLRCYSLEMMTPQL